MRELDFEAISQAKVNITKFREVINRLHPEMKRKIKLFFKSEEIEWDNDLSLAGFLFEHLKQIRIPSGKCLTVNSENIELSLESIYEIINRCSKKSNKRIEGGTSVAYDKSIENRAYRNYLKYKDYSVPDSEEATAEGNLNKEKFAVEIKYESGMEMLLTQYESMISHVEVKKLLESADYLTFKWGLIFKIKIKKDNFMLADLQYKKSQRKMVSLKKQKERHRDKYAVNGKSLFKKSDIASTHDVLRRFYITFFKVNPHFKKMLNHRGDLRITLPDTYFYPSDWKAALKWIRLFRGDSTEFVFVDYPFPPNVEETRPWHLQPEKYTKDDFYSYASALNEKMIFKVVGIDLCEDDESYCLIFLQVCLLLFIEYGEVPFYDSTFG